jgi:hypothetical protein
MPSDPAPLLKYGIAVAFYRGTRGAGYRGERAADGDDRA